MAVFNWNALPRPPHHQQYSNSKLGGVLLCSNFKWERELGNVRHFSRLGVRA